MGNCVACCYSQTKKQNKGPLIEAREIEVDALVPVEKMNTASASSQRYMVVRRKLKHGEVYYLAQYLSQYGKPLVLCRTSDNRKLKIVVTTEQLELLLSGSKKFQTKSRVARVRKSSRLHRYPKWHPSLPTIQEVHNF